ncbi:MAG: hypothetical protein OXF74_07650 [Rhodobacteraceae bacterium]|nr:hypothetical protein [Paracoccaceae bacterium]
MGSRAQRLNRPLLDVHRPELLPSLAVAASSLVAQRITAPDQQPDVDDSPSPGF